MTITAISNGWRGEAPEDVDDDELVDMFYCEYSTNYGYPTR